MYNMGDETYKNQPKFISKRSIIYFAEKLKDYTIKFNINTVFISFHGGEPLLASKEDFIFYVETIKNTNLHIQIIFLMQTNGVLLNLEWAEILKKYNVNIGISLDGEKKINDKFRIKHNGSGSYDEIITNLKEIQNFDIVKGIISVVDVSVNSKDFYRHMKKINNLQLNILLPNINFSNIPKFYMPLEEYLSFTSDWLVSLYEVWKEDTERISIPFFELIIKLISGFTNFGNHLVGNCENGVAVIETNGDIEVIDALRTSFSGATRGKLNISKNNIEELHINELFRKYYYSHTEYLSEKCKKCSIIKICGGGFLVHRFDKNTGDFNNPSIYCKVLTNIIKHIKEDLYYETA
jgi:uncharacterized protein